MTLRYKTLVAALSALVVVLAVVLVWTATRPTEAPQADPTPSPTPTPTYVSSAGDAGDDHASDPAADAEAAWKPVVEHFARAYTDTRGGARPWRTRLVGGRTPPYVTEEVAAQLATVDVRNVPEGRYQGYEAVKTSAYELAVRVDYREGWSMVLYLNTDGTSWQVYAYDKYEE